MRPKMSKEERNFCQNIGKNIYKFRLKYKTTQKDLAEYLEISQPSLLRIENGEQRISVYLLSYVVEYFGVSMDKLIK